MEALSLAPRVQARDAVGRAEPSLIPTDCEPRSADLRVASSDVVDLLAVTLSQARFGDAVAAFATELARRFQCPLVAVGFLQGRYAKVVALSNSADFSEQQNLLTQIGNAMDECLDQSATIVYPPAHNAKPQIVQFHSALSRCQGDAVICSIPVLRAGEPRAVITFERPGNRPFAASTVSALENIAVLIGPVLDLQREREVSLKSLLAKRCSNVFKGVVGPRHLAAKALMLALTSALAIAAVVPVDYRITAPARLEGSVQRSIVAPADGFLKEIHVRPGAVVKRGQSLASLDQEAFDLERQKLESEIAQHENAYRDAVAKHDRSAVVTAQARIEEARAQLALINAKLGLANVVAPFEGIVIKGDLTQSLGAPVKQGDTLFTLAPNDDYRVMIEVDERDIADVKHDALGQLALAALPGELIALQVRRVTPVANAANGRNYFEVEATLNTPAAIDRAKLRPGLNGVAKLNVGQRSLLWTWTQRAYAAVRLSLWSWTR